MHQSFKRLSIAAIAALCIIGGSNWFGPLSALLSAQAQPQGESMPGPIIVDPPGPYRGHFYVPAPKDLTVRPTEFLSTFIVTYNGFTPQAQAAFQAAVDVWASQIQSAVPIRVTANWVPLGPGVLGSAGATQIYRDFAGAPVANTWFPVAIANKITGTDLNPTQDDIVANFSSTFTWYYGTDGNAGTNYDLMTVVLHELGHGLGFFGSMTVSGGNGSWGLSTGFPIMYDRFAINGSSQFLIDTGLFPNPSAALGAQLVSNNIFFAGPNVGAANGGFAGRLYAPNPFQGGSSYSHWSESTFPAGNINSLMTPQLGAGEAIHDTGPITRGLFTDIGWGSVCLYSLSSASLNIGGGGGAGSVNVITGAGCAWTAVSNVPFITINPGSESGTGNGTVNFTVAANSSAARSGTLTIGGQTFTVNQAAGLRRTGDYDGDGKTDITVFRPSSGVWHTVRSSSGTPTAFAWGNGADRPVTGDFDGDGKADIAVFRPSNGTWYIVPSTGAAPYGFPWGNGADITAPGDYDGDGKTDIAVFRPSNGTWYVVPSTGAAPYGFAWGNGADITVPGDYDGDGKTDIAVFRPSNGTWYVVPSTGAAPYGFPWGNGADRPVAADYDGDGKHDIAVFRPSNGTWYIVPSTTSVPYGYPWGNSADITVPADYDGDGKTDIAIFRPSSGTWFIVPSTTGVPYGVAWGNSADIPIFTKP